MAKDIKPESFSPIELNLFIQHLKLGHLHLEKQLGKEQFKSFLKWGALNEKQENKLKANLFERLSQAIPALNTIVTSIFGAFIGLSFLLGFDQGDLPTLCFVCCLVALTGGFIGYMSVRMTKNKARSALLTLTIYKIHLRLLEILNEKSEKELSATIYDLNKISEQLSNSKDLKLPMCEFKKDKEIQKWSKQTKALAYQIVDKLPNENIYELYRREILRHLDFIRSTLLEERKDMRELADTLTKFNEKQTSSHLNEKQSFIQILTDPNLLPSKATVSPSPWMRENLSSILFYVAPTMLGGFASLFVFVNGLPDIAKKVGILHSESIFIHPYAQVFELILMVFLTLYFGVSSLYIHRRAKERKKEISNFSQKIVSQETEYLAKTDKLRVLKVVKDHLKDLLQIIHLLQSLLPEKQEEKDLYKHSEVLQVE